MSKLVTKKILTVPQLHQKAIALSTLKMSEIGARMAGGMDHYQAVQVLRDLGISNIGILSRLEKAGYSQADIQRFMKQ